MINMRFYKVIIINLVAVLFSGLVFCSSADAAPSSFANAAQGIEISPTLVELNSVRGKVYNVNLNVRNITAADLVYTTSVADFSAADETGSPKIVMDDSLLDSLSIRSWVSVLNKFSLKSRQSQTVTAQITIPQNAEPGGHYGVIRFTSGAPELSDNGVGLSGSAGVLILIKVDGDIVEKASLASFYTSSSDSQTGFFENGPIKFVSRIKNEGNIHIKPTGSIVLKNFFGSVVATLAVNTEKSNILPNSIRKFESQFNKKWMIGKYSADLALGFGSAGQAIIGTTSFWVIPYRLIIICLLASATLIYILVRLIKVYNRHIITKAKNENAKKEENNKEQDSVEQKKS